MSATNPYINKISSDLDDKNAVSDNVIAEIQNLLQDVLTKTKDEISTIKTRINKLEDDTFVSEVAKDRKSVV